MQQLRPVLLLIYPGHLPNTCGFCGVCCAYSLTAGELWIASWSLLCRQQIYAPTRPKPQKASQPKRKWVNQAALNWDSGIMLVDSHLLVYNDWLLICLQTFYRGYSSGCIEMAEQPSLMEKGSRTTLYYSVTKGQCTWSCPPHTGTHVQHGTGKDSPRWTAYISTVGLLKLQSSTEQIGCNQEMGTTGSY